MVMHRLKTQLVDFERVAAGEKTFEIRRNDRCYQAGDDLVLREFDPAACQHESVAACRADRSHECRGFTGRVMAFEIGFVYQRAAGRLDCGDHVVMSLLPTDEEGGPVDVPLVQVSGAADRHVEPSALEQLRGSAASLGPRPGPPPGGPLRRVEVGP